MIRNYQFFRFESGLSLPTNDTIAAYVKPASLKLWIPICLRFLHRLLVDKGFHLKLSVMLIKIIFVFVFTNEKFVVQVFFCLSNYFLYCKTVLEPRESRTTIHFPGKGSRWGHDAQQLERLCVQRIKIEVCGLSIVQTQRNTLESLSKRYDLYFVQLFSNLLFYTITIERQVIVENDKVCCEKTEASYRVYNMKSSMLVY